MSHPDRYPLGRRDFLGAAVAGLGLIAGARSSHAIRVKMPARPVFVSTWPFGAPANKAAWKALTDGKQSLLNACITGVTVTERDPTVNSVGKGGLPNAAGVVQLDACVMDGPTAGCGAVCALEGITTAASVARAVMLKTDHILLAGRGARDFALSQGFKTEQLLSDEARARWEKWKRKRKKDPLTHDTIGMLGVNAKGNLAGVCTTSGLAWKIPGRVGDSPLIGHGLFVDEDVGAACATGVGEEVIRICGSHTVVELMRQGRSPQRACEEACRRIIRANRFRRGKTEVPPDAFLAVNKRGQFGAYSVHQGYFRYAVTTGAYTRLVQAKGVLPKRGS